MATAPFSCFAVAAPGLEPIVAKELARLGEQPRVDDGGVAWDGDARSVMRANLWLRSATRVLVRIASFEATTFRDLEKHAKRVPWDRLVAPGTAADFRVTARKSRLYHSDAIAERLLKFSGLESAEHREPKAGRQQFVVRFFHDQCEISIDSSGELLHKRGYREAGGKAPMRETLAAAMLLAAEWDGSTPLLDPLCGSGTIAIEGALLARRIAPGLRRTFAFAQWPGFDAAAWKTITDDARSNELARAPAPIIGSDRDAGAIAIARANAERAGVTADIAFNVAAVSAMQPPTGRGLVATNPPYGKRASAGRDLRNLYAQLGNVLRERCAGWRVVVLTPNAQLGSQLGLTLRPEIRTANGGIKIAVSLADVAN